MSVELYSLQTLYIVEIGIFRFLTFSFDFEMSTVKRRAYKNTRTQKQKQNINLTSPLQNPLDLTSILHSIFFSSFFFLLL